MKTRNISQEEGFILPYILLIAMLIITSIFFYISLLHFRDKCAIKNTNKKKLELACFSALQREIAFDTISAGNTVITNDSIEIHIKRDIKLFYNEFIITAKNKIDSAKVIYLTGEIPSREYSNALIISMPELKGSYAGNTMIIGDILAANNYFARENILGIKNTETDFLKGNITVNKNIAKNIPIDIVVNNYKKLALLDTTGTKYYDNLHIDSTNIGDIITYKKIIVNGNLSLSGNLNYSAAEPIKIFVKNQTILNNNTVSSANIEIISSTSVIIEENCKLNNLIICAGKNINIKSKSTFGNVQIVGGESISIDHSLFNYPSTIGLVLSKYSPEYNLNINSSIINGTLFSYLPDSLINKNKTAQNKIMIDKNSLVQGLVYSNTNAEIYGKIEGILYTYNILYTLRTANYINWLINLQIDRSRLSRYFLMPVGFQSFHKSKILSEKWLY